MANFLGTPKLQYFDNNGDPLSGGLLYSYYTGTTTAKATYPTLADALAGTNANTNPVVLDSRGEANVVMSGSYKFVLKTSAGTTLWTVDNVGSTTNVLLLDAYSNDVIILGTGGALSINQVTVTNAATGAAPQITATGTDTNIDLKVASKGSGILKLDGGATGTVDVGTVSTGAINLKRNTAVTGTLSSSGAATLNSLGVTGAATVGTTLGVTGATSLSTMSTSGAATLNSTVITNSATVGTTLGVTGASTLASLGVTGAATVGTTLGVTGNTTLTGTLATGAVTLNSTINTFTFPSTDGTANQVLKTNGSKVLSFTTVTPDSSKPAFRVTKSAAQTITSGAGAAKVTWDTETFDTNSNFDSATNYRFTPTVAGYYNINVVAFLSATDITNFYIYLYKNGANILGVTALPEATTGATVAFSDLVYMNGSTDYLELYSTCTATGTPQISHTATGSNWSGYLVIAA